MVKVNASGKEIRNDVWLICVNKDIYIYIYIYIYRERERERERNKTFF